MSVCVHITPLRHNIPHMTQHNTRHDALQEGPEYSAYDLREYCFCPKKRSSEVTKRHPEVSCEIVGVRSLSLAQISTFKFEWIWSGFGVDLEWSSGVT